MIEAIFQGLGSADLTVAACLGTKGKRVTSPTQQLQHLQDTGWYDNFVLEYGLQQT